MTAGLISSIRRFRRIAAETSGSAIVEFTMVLPALVIIMMGILYFGLTLNNYLELTRAVNNATRLVAVTRLMYPVTYNGTSYTEPCSLARASLAHDSPTLKTASMTTTVNIAGTGYSGATCAGADSNLSTNSTAGVSVAYPYIDVRVTMGSIAKATLFSGSFTASSTSVVQ